MRSAPPTTLEEATDAAQETLEYELDEEEGEKLTPALMKDKLKDAIKESVNKEEAAPYQTALDAINAAEKQRKDAKASQKQKRFDLDVKIALKKFGTEDETLDACRLLVQAEKELGEQEKITKPENEKAHRKKVNALKSDIKALNERIDAIERLSASVGGMIGAEEAKELILQKHHDLVTGQVERYAGNELRILTNTSTNFFEKYFQSSDTIKSWIFEFEKQLQDYLNKLYKN